MKFLKIGLLGIGAFALVLLMSLVIFAVTFDANDYRPQIQAQVEKATGRTFEVADIKPSIFPWVGIELQQLSLGNARGFTNTQMVSIEKLDVKIEMLPLIKQSIHIDTLRVHGMTLNLGKNAQGISNWADMLEPSSQETEDRANQEAPTEPGRSDDEPGFDPLAALLVNGIEIRDASIQWHDQQAGQKVQVAPLNFETGAIQLDTPVPLKLTAFIESSAPEAKAEVQLDTNLKIQAGMQQLSLQNLKLQLDANSGLVPGGAAQLVFEASASVDMQNKLVTLPNYTLKTFGLNMQGNATLSDFANPSGQLEIQPFNARQLAQKLGIVLPPMQSATALQTAAIKLDFAMTPAALAIHPLAIKLDASTLTGRVDIKPLSPAGIRYDLKMDQITLDDYMPPAVEAETTDSAPAANIESTQSAGAAEQDIAIELPVELIRSLNVAGQLNIGSIQLKGQSLSQFVMQTKVSDGVVNISELTAQLLEGHLQSQLRADVRQEIPKYTVSLQAKGLRADSLVTPILQELSGEEAVTLRGATDFDASINTRGVMLKQLKANTNGELKLNVGKAEITGVDAEYFVRKAVAGYLEGKGQDATLLRSAYQPKETTALRVARASAQIRQGVVTNNDLLLEASRFKVSGAGTVVLHEETIDYRMIVDLNPASTNTSVEKLLDVPVPVKIRGRFNQPDIGIDKGDWLKNIARASTAQKTQEIKQQAEQKVEQKVEQKKSEIDQKVEEKKEELKEKLFKGLFGR